MKEERIGRRKFLKNAFYFGAAVFGTSLGMRFLLDGFSQDNDKDARIDNSTNSTAFYSCQTNLGIAVSEKTQLDSLLADYKNTTARLLQQIDNHTTRLAAKDADVARYSGQLNDLKVELARVQERLNSTAEALNACRASRDSIEERMKRIREAFER